MYPPPDLSAWDQDGSWTEVRYPSEPGDLVAYYYVPDGELTDPVPALLYLHPGLGAGQIALDDVRPFAAAGFAILVPAFRGENGNPGLLEFWLGEVDDAVAAAEWLEARPEVDAEAVFALGWSYGGGVAALLSLMPDVPVRHSASIGGLATDAAFESLAGVLPFDLEDEAETSIRTLVGNTRWMQHRHFAYLGSADVMTVGAVEAVNRESEEDRALLEITVLPGSHEPPLAAAAIRVHLARIRDELGQGRRP